MLTKLARRLTNAKSNFIFLFHKYETSSLYVTGDKAQETYSVLVPYLDLESRFQNVEKLKKNVKVRRMDVDVDLLKKLWDLYKIAEIDREILETGRVKIAEKIKELSRAGAQDTDAEIKKYMLQGKMLRDDLKVHMKGLWGLEKQAIIKALSLPNDLDDDTPSCDAKLVHTFGEKSISCSIENPSFEKGRCSCHINYSDPSCYYLKDEAALFELEVQYYFAEELQKIGFVQFSNADFAWSIVVEGCGIDHRDPNSVFILQDDDPTQTNEDHRLHLVGGASLISFCAYHAKHLVDHNSLPLKYFTLGRKYEPTICSIDKNVSSNIYGSWQASAVELFIASHDDTAAKCEFRVALESIISLYEKLGCHFRVVYLPPSSLHAWESLRASFQMYLYSRQSYVEVGNISLSNSYISKRLRICYKKNKQEQHFLSLISGTVLSVPKLLACITENGFTDSANFPQLLCTS